MSDAQPSLTSDTKTCPKCGATWIGGQHYWSGTGKLGNELDLAGLVCNNLGDETCINPCVGASDFLGRRSHRGVRVFSCWRAR